MLPVYAALLAGDRLDRSAPCRAASSRVQDQGYAIVVIQLPDGASLSRTNEVVLNGREDRCAASPGVENAVAFAGFSGATFTNAVEPGRHLRRLQAVSTERNAQGGQIGP